MKINGIDDYIKRLERELAKRGLFNPEISNEVESHLLDSRDNGIRMGLDSQVAEEQAIKRFGSARAVARKYDYGRKTMKQKLLFAAAVIFGLVVTFVDSRPTWNDTGITVFALLIGTGIIGLLAEKRPWLFALAVGLWLPLWYIVTNHDLSMIIVLAFPFIGMYAGWAMHLGLRKLRQTG